MSPGACISKQLYGAFTCKAYNQQGSKFDILGPWNNNKEWLLSGGKPKDKAIGRQEKL
jgi:hypothetical protein